MIDADTIAVAQLLVSRYGPEAPVKARGIVEQHRREETEDAGFWASVAEIVDALALSQDRAAIAV
jgi:hypothetical protein